LLFGTLKNDSNSYVPVSLDIMETTLMYCLHCIICSYLIVYRHEGHMAD